VQHDIRPYLEDPFDEGLEGTIGIHLSLVQTPIGSFLLAHPTIGGEAQMGVCHVNDLQTDILEPRRWADHLVLLPGGPKGHFTVC
jgi:hypothetical protein